MFVDNTVDMICQHTKEGTIIPLKIRLIDEDGERQQYNIRRYRILSHEGKVILPSEVGVTTCTLRYECVISVFGQEKMLQMLYNIGSRTWRII